MEKNFWANKPRHKAIALVLLVCMLMTLVPAMAWAADTTPKTVNDATGLLQAVTSSSSIQLGANITTNAALTIASDVIVELDLNGHKLELTTPSVLTVEGALTITDTSSSVSGSFVGTAPTEGNIAITGGIFSFDPTKFVPSGSYKVTANSANNTWTVTKSEKIEVPVETIVISGDQEIKAGDSQGVTLTAVLTPNNATTGTTLTWKSSNSNVTVTPDNVTNKYKQTVKVVANEKATVGDRVTITVSNEVGVEKTYSLTVKEKDTVDIPVADIILDKSTLSLAADAFETVEATFNPPNANQGTTLTWTGHDESIAKVVVSADTHSAKITGAGPGTTTVTVSNGSISKTCIVTVAERPVTEIKLSSEQLNLLTNDTGNLTATLLPANATTGTTLTWKSDNTAVVTVTPATDTRSAAYKAVGEGNATITVTNGTLPAVTCTVTVSNTAVSVESIILDKTKLSLDLNGSATGSIRATVSPAGANKETALTWTSADPTVATVTPVNTTGTGEVTVTAVGVGETTITVTNGKLEAVCTVTVSDTEIKVTGIKLFKLVTDENNNSTREYFEDKATIPLATGAVLGLNAEVIGTNVEQEPVSWTISSTSATNVVEIDENHVVTAKNVGDVTIKASVDGQHTEDGMPKEVTCVVSVKAVAIPSELATNEVAQALGNNTAAAATVDGTKSQIATAANITDPNSQVYLDTKLEGVQGTKEDPIITFAVQPMVIRNITGENGEKTTQTAAIANDDLSGSITFRLPMPNTIPAEKGIAKVVHKISNSSRVEYLYLSVEEDANGNRFIDVTVKKFSNFEVSFTNELPAEAPKAIPNKGTGTYVGTQIITLDIPDGAQVYYTVDGSEPTVANAFLYETAKPIEIKTTTTLKVLVVHPDYLDGNYEYTYTITNGGDDGIIDGGDSGSGGSSGGGSTGGGGGTVVTPNNNSWDNPYFDVSSTAWYYNAVKYAVEKGLFSGVTDTQFGPNVSMTRGMLVTVLYKLEGRPAAGGNSFIDVSSNAYYSNAVAWAASKNIVSGIGDGMFAPGQAISREQMVVILYKYAQSKGMDTSASASLSNFADYDKVSPWAREAMQWAVGAGLISGKNGSILDPTGTATRAEVASILMNFLED